MSVISLLNDPEWDFPFFKKLANNDTGAARGHQGGMIIPMDLRPFSPGLSGTTSSINPTIEHHITVWLLVDGRQRGRVQTRYQYIMDCKDNPQTEIEFEEYSTYLAATSG